MKICMNNIDKTLDLTLDQSNYWEERSRESIMRTEDLMELGCSGSQRVKQSKKGCVGNWGPLLDQSIDLQRKIKWTLNKMIGEWKHISALAIMTHL